ncbi:cytochrome c biogenesis protein [Arenimonas maotaiensis]|uniref:Cytochrome c-type biogenesis protein n=1 Tax=Arenimonas maotaiensis TaxID=1446479 RepID=A0A917FNE6_9GAMM|nr:cytochrome c-type biogenesis protein [Arenimonas maotaiensis]GGF92770.1 cytochrome c biogenesis protein [Arenimonas maotaiensis]
MRTLLVLLALLLGQTAAALEPVDYRSAAEEQRFKALTAELRCVMCQNQSIADSNAPIAHDLRREVLALMREGRSNDEIKQYLVERYTDFVLYEPPMRGGNWLLWVGPFLILLAGGIAVYRIIRRKQPAAAAPAADNEEW